MGYIGAHETINALFGNQIHMFVDNEQLREKAVSIVARLKAATESVERRNRLRFQPYSTPSENLCNHFYRIDTFKFGVIPGVTDKAYYTNNFHLDVEKKVKNPYQKINFELPYHL
ncbi:MAG: anaerobic ribonucleoside-triphosphate reductase [Symbiopectobacterium sp.]